MKKPIQTLLCMSVLCALGTAPVMAAELATTNSSSTTANAEDMKDAQETVQEAAKVVEQIKADPKAKNVLARAKAVFIVPDYAKASLGVGGAGGEGLLMANNGSTWSGPAFYNIGSVSVGLQAGVEAGSIAFLVMSDKGMKGFRNENNFSLNADAGLTVVNYSRRGQATLGKGEDVVVWADTEGLHGDLSVSVADIMWDDDANQAYYQGKIAATDIINGTAQARTPAASPLKSEFSALESQSGSKRAPATLQAPATQTPENE